ncbi:MAG: hypothetical protein ACE363_00145 [Alphaproteobacteria bacterium]
MSQPPGHDRADTLLRICFPLIAVIGALVYLFILSNGTWNLFVGEWMGLVYSDYLLAILDGRLDIKQELIQHEGFYADDGRVYTYFGVLPAFLRVLWMPFVDLATVDVSRPTLWILLCLSALLSQWLVWRVYRTVPTVGASVASATLIIVLWVFLWFAGPTMLLSANASVYHQPIIVSYLLSLIYLWVLLDAGAAQGRIRAGLLPWLALIAGLAVHTRPTLAIGLYAATVGLCALEFYRLYTEADAAAPQQRLWAATKSVVLGPIALTMIIMLIAGLLVFFLNWVRWGDPMMTAPMDRYGSRLFLDPDPERYGSIDELGSFSWRRIPANVLLYLVPLLELHERLASMFSAGYIRKELPVPGILSIWILPLLLVVRFGRSGKAPVQTSQFRVVVAGFLIVVLMTLAFQTITFRYWVDLWPALFILLLASIPGAVGWLANVPAHRARVWTGLFAVLGAVGIYWMVGALNLYKSLAWFAAADTPL